MPILSTSTAFVSLPYSNGFTNFGNGFCAGAYFVGTARILLRGVIRIPNVGIGSTPLIITTLPQGPSATEIFTAAGVTIYVNPDGTVVLQPPYILGSAVVFSGVSFSTLI